MPKKKQDDRLLKRLKPLERRKQEDLRLQIKSDPMLQAS